MYVWVTRLSRLLVGGASCEWTSWTEAQHSGHAKVSRDFSLSTWKMQHTRLLNDVRDRLEAEGHSVTTEHSNWFRLQGNSGALVSGQTDLIPAPDGRLVYRDGTEIQVPASAIDNDFRKELLDLFRRVVSDERARDTQPGGVQLMLPDGLQLLGTHRQRPSQRSGRVSRK